MSAKKFKNFDKNFRPDLSPKEMLELGVFGGVYLQGDMDEFPKDWFKKAKLQKAGFNGIADTFSAEEAMMMQDK